MAQWPDCALWDFSLAVYGREGVAPACLALQERHGVDVNLLLYCCWRAASGRGAPDRAELERIVAAIAPWHGEVVRGLRAVRQRLKSQSGPGPAGLAAALRKRIGAVELEAEHIEQIVLAEGAPPAREVGADPPRRAAAAATAMLAYLAVLGAAPGAADRADLAAVLAGCFPALAREAIARLVAEAADGAPLQAAR
jgi:uncharacterized protein (TIGR02444 family)